MKPIQSLSSFRVSSFITVVLLTIAFLIVHSGNARAKSSELDTAGKWLEINKGFAPCPKIDEVGGEASIFSDHFNVINLLNRRGKMYALIRFHEGCMPALFQHDTVTNRWRCVAKTLPEMNLIRDQYGDWWKSISVTDGQDILLVNKKGVVYKFTKDYDNPAYPLSEYGWKEISENELTEDLITDGYPENCSGTDCYKDPLILESKKHPIRREFVGGYLYIYPEWDEKESTEYEDTDYDDDAFRLMRFSVKTGEWKAIDLAPVPRASFRKLSGGSTQGLSLAVTEPIAGRYSIHVAYHQHAGEDVKDSTKMVHTWDPYENKWINITKGVALPAEEIHEYGGEEPYFYITITSSWDNQDLVAKSKGGIMRWTGNSWVNVMPPTQTQLMYKDPNTGDNPILTDEGVLIYDEHKAHEKNEFFYTDPNLLEMRNTYLPDPNMVYKEGIEKTDLYENHATPDNGKTWYSSFDVPVQKAHQETTDVSEEFQPYEGYSRGIYYYSIEKDVTKQAYNLHVDHGTYIGGKGTDGNLSVGVAITPISEEKPEGELVVAGNYASVEGTKAPGYEDTPIFESDGTDGKLLRFNAKGDTLLSAITLGAEVHDFDDMAFGEEYMVVSGSWGVTMLNAHGDSVRWTLPASEFDSPNSNGYLKVDIDNSTGNVVVMRNASGFYNTETGYMNTGSQLSGGSMWFVNVDGTINSALGVFNPAMDILADVAINNDTVVAAGSDTGTGRIMYFDVSGDSWTKYVDSGYYDTGYVEYVYEIDFHRKNTLIVTGHWDNYEYGSYNDGNYYMMLDPGTGKANTRKEFEQLDLSKGTLHLTEDRLLHICGAGNAQRKGNFGSVIERGRKITRVSGEILGDYLEGEPMYFIRDLEARMYNYIGGFNRNAGLGGVYDVDTRLVGTETTKKELAAGVANSHSGDLITGKYVGTDTTYGSENWKFEKDSAMISMPFGQGMDAYLFVHNNPPHKYSGLDSLEKRSIPGDTLVCPGYEDADLDFEVPGRSGHINISTKDTIQFKNLTEPEYVVSWDSLLWDFGSDASQPVNMPDENNGPHRVSWNTPGDKIITLEGPLKVQMYDTSTNTCETVKAYDSVSSINKKLYVHVLPDNLELRGPMNGVFHAVCPGSVIDYSIPGVEGINEYEWSIPDDWEIISSDKTSNSISVFIGNNSGEISVKGVEPVETDELYKTVNVTGENNDILYVASDGKYIVDDLDHKNISGYHIKGLYRKNGGSWTKYDYIQHSIGLSTDFNDIETGPDGNIWIATAGNGLTKWDGSEFTSFYNKAPTNSVNDIAFDNSGDVWITSNINNGQVYKYDTSESEWSNDIEGTDGNRLGLQHLWGYETPGGGFLSGLAVDASGNVWVGYEQKGIFKYDGSKWTFFSETEKRVDTGVVESIADGMLNEDHISDLIVDNSGNIWIAHGGGYDFSNGGVTRFDPSSGSWDTWTSGDGLFNDNVISIEQDSDGNIWVGHSQYGYSGVSMWDGGSWSTYSSELSSTAGNDDVYSIEDITADNSGNVWFTSNGQYHDGNSIVKYDGSNWTYNECGTNGLDEFPIKSVEVDNNGDVWTGAYYSTNKEYWYYSTEGGVYYGKGYSNGGKQMTFTPNLKSSEEYEVFVRWPSSSNKVVKAGKLQEEIYLDIQHKNGVAKVWSDSLPQEKLRTGEWQSLGTYDFLAGDTSFVRWKGKVADAVMFERTRPGYSQYDSNMVERLDSLGYDVTMVPDRQFKLDQLTCTRSVFLSPTARTNNIPPNMSGYEIPVIASSVGSFSELGYVDNIVKYGKKEHQFIQVEDASKELATGLETPHSQVYDKSALMNWAMPDGEYDTIATNEEHITYFSYESGDMMSGLKAPERQVGVYFYNDRQQSQNNLTALSDSVLKYSACWVQRNCPGDIQIEINEDTIHACQGSEFDVSYTVKGDDTLSQDNEFIVQMSNKYGTFTGLGIEKEIARDTGTTGGEITATLGEDVVVGEDYKIRMASTNPSKRSVNLASVVIHASPANVGTIEGHAEFCVDSARKFKLTDIGDQYKPERFEWVRPENSEFHKNYTGDTILDSDPRRMYSNYGEATLNINENFESSTEKNLKVRIKDSVCGWTSEEDYTEVTIKRFGLPAKIDTSDIGVRDSLCPGDDLVFNTSDLSRSEDKADYYRWRFPEWMDMESNKGVEVRGSMHDTVSHGMKGKVYVQGVNHCGVGPENYKELVIDTTLKPEMDSIIGPKRACEGDVIEYVYKRGWKGVNYNWITPKGVTVENQNQNIVELRFSITIPSGMIIAQAVNGCGAVEDTIHFTMDTTTNALLITHNGTLDYPVDQLMYDKLIGKDSGVHQYIEFDHVDVIDDHAKPGPLLECYELIISSLGQDTVVRDTVIGDPTMGDTTITPSGDTILVDTIYENSTYLNKIHTNYTSSRTPIIVNNPDLYDEMKLASVGGTDSTDYVFVEDKTHPITNNFSLGEDVPVYDTILGYVGGAGYEKKSIKEMLYEDAYTFATVSDEDYSLISYDYGDILGTEPGRGDYLGRASGRRLAFYMAHDSVYSLSEEGGNLFDRAVCWATNTCDTSLRIETKQLPQNTGPSQQYPEYCLGDSTEVNFEVLPEDETLNPGNTFKVQLSNGSGNFINPTVIGSKTAQSDDAAEWTIPVQFPESFVDQCVVGGDEYRVRVVSTDPEIIGEKNMVSAGGPQYITLESCETKSYDTIRKYKQMDPSTVVDFCGFICDSIEGLPEKGSLRMNGTDNDITIGSGPSSDMVDSSFTLETWIEAKDYGSSAEDQTLFYCEDNNTGDVKYSVYIDKDDGSVNFKDGPNAGDDHDSYSNVLNNNDGTLGTGPYNHIAVVVEVLDATTSNLKIYVNGSEVVDKDFEDVSAGEPGRIASGDDWYIGNNTGSQYYKGLISDARIWNEVRTTDALEYYKHKCPEPYPSSLVALYQFNDGSGSTVTDGVNGYSGVIGGSGYEWVEGKNIPCGEDSHMYDFYAELSDYRGDYPGYPMPDTVTMADTTICGKDRDSLTAYLPGSKLMHNEFYEYRMMGHDLDDGSKTSYDDYAEFIWVKDRAQSYLSDQFVHDFDCFGDTAGGHISFTLNMEGDSLFKPLKYYFTYPNGMTDTVTNISHPSDAKRQYPGIVDSGTYNLVVVDYAGYSDTFNFEVEKPEKLRFTSVDTTNVSGPGAEDGEISVEVDGGTTPYDFYWLGEDTTMNTTGPNGIQSLSPGLYNLNVVDSNECLLADTFNLGTGTGLELERDSVSEETCYGNDGYIAVKASGGESPYTFSSSPSEDWESINDSTAMIDSLTKNLYDVEVEDDNGAIYSIKVGINRTPDPEPSINGPSVYYPGQEDVSFNVTGEPGHVYSWSVSGGTIDGAQDGDSIVVDWSDQSESGVAVRVQDSSIATGCVGYDSIQLEISDELNVSLAVDPISCHVNDDGDHTNGSITANVTGGTQPYYYKWSNGQTSSQLPSVSEGTYSLTVTDSVDNKAIDSAEVSMPDSLRIIDERKIGPYCGQTSDGEIEIEVEGGTPPYSYNWENEYEEIPGDSIVDGLEDQITYTVNILDGNNCETEKSYNLEPEHEVCLNIPSGFSPNGDGQNDRWVIANTDQFSKSELEVVVFDRRRNIVFQSTGYEEPWDGTSQNGRELPVGTYHYIIKLNNDTYTGQITIFR